MCKFRDMVSDHADALRAEDHLARELADAQNRTAKARQALIAFGRTLV